ncbi:MAG: universal stress protein [Oligoflexales bacterium]|nr:universal stress protein [Oligoflexales bacterium]
MKIVLGLDSLERAKDISSVVQGLNFEKSELELVHILERLDETNLPMQGAQIDLVNQYIKMQEEEAKAFLAEGQTALMEKGLAVKTKLLSGFTANRIIAHAQESKADLLVVGSSGKGRIKEVLIGSVGRKALSSAKCSVLIAKKPFDTKRPMNVVFATDHSDYANRCVDKFLSWNPKGIGRTVVATIYPEQLLMTMQSIMPNLKTDMSNLVRGELDNKNKAVTQKFTQLGIESKSRVESGLVGDTLEKIMKEENADLLIMGAQGHGFVELMTIGSISLDQGLRRPYSVLVVRA